MDEKFARYLFEKLGYDKGGKDYNLFKQDLNDDGFKEFVFDKAGYKSGGLDFNKFKQDLGGGQTTNNGATRTIKFAPEQEALLRVISKVESGNRPNVIVGEGTFDDYSKHPKKVGVVTGYGSSDAAGPYQFLSSTYEPIAEELGLDSFDVDNQSIAALHLAEKDYSRRTGGDDIYKAIKRGDYEKVRKGLAGEGKNTTWQALQNYNNFESDFVRFLKEERAGKGTPVSRPTTPTPTVQKKTSEQLMDELTGSVAKNQAAQTDQQTAINRLTGTENDYSQEPDLDVAINNSKKVMANQRQGKSSFTDGNRRIVTKDSAIDWSQGVVTDPAGKKVQIVTETNFPVGSLSPGGVGVPGPDLTTEITDEQKQAQAKLIEKNVDQAALNKLEEANAALGNVNFDNINKYKGVEATLPIDVDFDNQELRNKKVIVYPNKKENTDSESFNSARADLARFTAANSAILESSDHFLKKEFGNNWSKDVSNIYNQVNPIVETLNNLGAQIEKELGSTVPEVKGHKELVNNYLSNKQSLDGLINSYNGVQEKLAAINANVNTLTADYEAGKISQADYESGYASLSQQFDQISAETQPLEEQIKTSEQTLAEIKAQEKAVLAEYNSKVADKDKHPLVKQYKQAVDRYESLMDKVEPYENNAYFKKYSKAYNDLTDTKDVYANVFKDRVQKEAETKRLQELSDFYVKSLPKDPTLTDDFNRIRTDLSFAVKNIFSDDLGVGGLSVGVKTLKGFVGKFVGDLAALTVSTPLSISDKTKSLADVVNYGDFLSLEALQQDTNLSKLSTRTDWQGGFKENRFEIKPKLDQELIENIGLNEGDNLIVDGNKVVAVRDKDGFKKDISTWDANTYNYVNKYVKDSDRKTESDVSFSRGAVQSAGSILDFVALIYGAGKLNTALKAGATKFGVSASERLTSTVATTGVAFGQIYGNNLKEYLDKGLDPSKAVAAAIAKTGVSAMVETVIGPMEARLVAGGATKTVLANFRKVRDTTMDLVVRGKIGTQDALRLIGKATGMGLRDGGVEYAEEVVQNTTDKVSDFLFSGEKIESMTFNEHVNTMFTVGLIQILPAIQSGRVTYNTGKVDLITTALYQFSQDPSAISKIREDIKNGDSNITESQLAEIEQITPYIKDEVDLYDVDKNRKVAITGLITDRYYKEQKLKSTTNPKAKEKLQESIDTINTEIEGVVSGDKVITIDPTAVDFTEEDNSVAVPVTEIEEAEIVIDETTNDAVGTTTTPAADTQTETTEPIAQQEEAIVEDVPPVTPAETQVQNNVISTAPEIKSNIDNLGTDNYLFTHVTTEDNARNIIEGGMSISVGTGISSTLTQLNANGVNDQISRLQAGEVVHRDLNNNSVAVISVPKAELDAIQGKDIAEKFELWLAENNRINEKGQYSIPAEFNAGYLTKEGFVGRSGANTNTTLQDTLTSQQGVSTTETENIENVAPMSTNTASSLPLTLTDVTLTNKAGTITTGTFTYNEEKQTWSKVNPNGKKTPVNSQAQKDQLNTLRQEKQQQAAMDDVSIINSKSDDIISELNKLKTPKEKLNWLKEKGLITPIVINGKSYNSIDYSDRIMVLAKIGKYNIPFYISTGQAGKKNVKAGNWYAIFGIGESGWINKGSEELINKQYDFPVFQKIAKILNEGVGNFESREDNGNGKIKDFVGYMEDTKKAISEFNKQMGLPITPAKNNTESKVFYENVNSILNLINSELNSLSSNNTQTTTEITPPTEAQRIDDLKNNRFATFTYDNESQVPEIFRDRISSRGELNGKPFVKVTLPQSIADYELAKQSLQDTQTTEQGVSTTAPEIVQNTAPITTNTGTLPNTIKAENTKLRKSKEEDGVYNVVAGDQVIGSMYYDRSSVNGWIDSNYVETSASDFTGYLGRNKEEAIQSMVDRYNNNNNTNEKESTNQTSNNDEGQTNTQEGQVGSTVGQEGEVSTDQPITEAEVETLLEEIGADSKAREEQIYKFFALPAALGDKTKAREIARITNTLWENVAKQLSKRSGKTADAWIKSRVAMLGKTSVADAKARGNAMFQVIGEQGAAALDQAQEATTRLANSIAAGNVRLQSNNTDNYTTAEAATAVANNLITELDRMIAERSDKDAIKARGWTMTQAATDLKNLRAIKAELQKNMKDPKWQVDAYHGTPHVFDRFTTDKIGTGEGAQAFGWGLYFTDLKSIAKNYADVLSRKGSEIGWEDYATISDKKLLQNNPSLSDFETIKNKTLAKLKKGIESDTFYGPKHFENLVTQLESDSYNNYKYKAKSTPSKNIYKVSLHKGKTPDQYTWLEWDKELSQKQIQDLLDNDFDGSIAEALTNYYTENNDISTTKELIDTMYNGNITGKNLYGILQENVGENPSDKAASIALLNAGIDGVKYPAESISRGLTSDNARGFNYVVFDENAVTIEERVQFQQEAAQFRAAAIEVAKNQVIIAALDAPNESSFAHEMAHSFEPDLTTEERQTFIDDYNEQFSDNTKDWNTDVSEFFARVWEKYLSNGRKVGAKEVKDPKKRRIIQEVFDKFTEYLQGIYNGVITYNNSKGVTKPIEVSPAAQAVFDNIMGIKPTTQTDGNNAETPSVTAETKPEPKTDEEQILDTLDAIGMTPEMLALIGGVEGLIDYVDVKKLGKKKCK